MTYQPINTRVLLKILPIDASQTVLVPDHMKNKVAMQRFRIEDLGPAVVDEKFPLAKGQIVQIVTHPTLLIGVDAAAQLCAVDRNDIAVIVTEDAPTQVNN